MKRGSYLNTFSTTFPLRETTNKKVTIMDTQNNQAQDAAIDGAALTPDLSYNKEFAFHFRKDELGNKRPSIQLELPVPTKYGIIEIIKAGGKQLDLLLEVTAGVIYAQQRSIISDDVEFTADKFDPSKVTWDFIANIPRSERTGSGIAKETWEAFAKDYSTVVISHAGKTADQAANAAKILVGKFQQVKTNKPVITKLLDNINVWFANTPNAEDFADVYAFLVNKAETLLKADDNALLENL